MKKKMLHFYFKCLFDAEKELDIHSQTITLNYSA